jgi:adenylate kinase
MARVNLYNGFVDELVDYYTWAQHINADQDPLTVFECLEHGLVKPLPKQPPLSTEDVMPLNLGSLADTPS